MPDSSRRPVISICACRSTQLHHSTISSHPAPASDMLCIPNRKDAPTMAEQQTTSANQRAAERGKAVLIGNYARQPFDLVRGEGSLLWDADGKRYLDLF